MGGVNRFASSAPSGSPTTSVETLVALAAARAARPRTAAGERIVPPANLHVTLAFLGSRPAGELPAIGAALRAAAAGAARPAAHASAATARRAASGCSPSTTRAGARRRLPSELQRAARGARRLPSASSGRGSRTSPCSGSASAPRPRAAAAGARRGRAVRRGCLHLTAATRWGAVRGSRTVALDTSTGLGG